MLPRLNLKKKTRTKDSDAPNIINAAGLKLASMPTATESTSDAIDPTAQADIPGHPSPSGPPRPTGERPQIDVTPTNDGNDFLSLKNLRLSQDFAAQAGVKKILTTVPCRKPQKNEFFRVRSGDEWSLETVIIEDKANDETFVVDQSMIGELGGQINVVCIRCGITRQGGMFLWAMKLLDTSGQSNRWYESALAAAKLAESAWITIRPNKSEGFYETFQATGNLPEPEWGPESLEYLIKLCFRDRLIRDLDHPLLRARRGEV